ncbi:MULTISPECIES: Chromate resistance protein ChrB [unclassified Paenibacillus]|uniref:Chromate resistance protein ChrB n=1 Tax=unclassified Paenibacillus TaxID=185978 RepID=UPI001AE6E4F3|nr:MULTISPECIES: Chromate resistance protein ChrB [unclassified Paenibacillus]MBP1154858.1 DNA-binding transcriptional regulator PaaX [Paenibacillus sp. PvP091]MBP1169758.1 DNA-binding transcriptional regulator PaaX [Paenibacillus sp. PvR098]MBP2440786.1 DNA-binding transcriptional regulator PaaX [Paenibacillus sp. PvP052]
MQNWLHLLYKIPRNPSKTRVYVWRKLKRLGAVLLHESVWCLPSTPKTREQLQWLVIKIQELGGEASLWESRPVLEGQDEFIIKEFLEQVDKDYAEILEELKKEEFDLAALSKKYQFVKTQDYFQSDLGERVLDALQASRGGKK